MFFSTSHFISLLFFLGVVIFMCWTCSPSTTVEILPEEPPALQGIPPKVLYEKYDEYKESTITDRWFKHKDIVPLIQQLSDPFKVSEAGSSIEGRTIYHLKLGTGPVKVLLWSQMHGDEPTATMALMDIFNFFATSDQFDDFKETLLDRLSIHILPLLNPDGAEKAQRRNALNVDLNRDAIRLQSPESRILKGIRDSIQADWGFNLHDQNKYYGAGRSGKSAAISFLAPAFNYKKEIDEKRADAMQLIVDMNNVLQGFVPGQVARYSDSFEPRAFGDNIQAWGTRTILIESGGLKGDPEKQELRKLHFVALLKALEAIAYQYYEVRLVNHYNLIPYNVSDWFHDLILREVNIKVGNQEFKVDLAFRREEILLPPYQDFYYRSYIRDMGDLSIFHGYEEVNLSDFLAVPGNVFPQAISNMADLRSWDPIDLLKRGYTTVYLEKTVLNKAISQLPIQFVKAGNRVRKDIKIGQNPSFLLKEGKHIRYAVVNGFLFDLDNEVEEIRRQWKEAF